MPKTLSDKGVTNLKPRAARYSHPDPELRGHYVRVTPNGAKSFCAVARDPASGKQVWATIGATDVLKIADARERARAAIKRIRAGLQPFEPPPVAAMSFGAVAENWFRRHVRARKLRSEAVIRRHLDRNILPVWAEHDFESLRRSDVAALLDRIEDNNGARQADYVLAIVRGIFNWYASRHDDHIPPIARGMRRTDPKSRKRARILDDDEIRKVWAAAEESGTFGVLVRLAFLTAQRREKIVSMKWADVVDGEWRIDSEDREKGNAGSLVLPKIAMDIIESRPRLASNPYVLAGRGSGHVNGFSKAKRDLDAKAKIAPWVVHDLRRTSRSLMSRGGVRPDIAERVMGHAIAGVEGIYDRHCYRDEKTDALKRLANVIATIINPRENVVALPNRKRETQR